MVLQVTGMSCGHCVSAVRRAVSALPGVTGVAVDLQSGTVTVEGTAALEAVRAAIVEEGYEVIG